MSKHILWMVTGTVMALSLILTACGQPAAPAPSVPAAPTSPAAPSAPSAPAAATPQLPQQEPVKPASDIPQYGGTLTVVTTTDQTNWDPVRLITGIPINLTHQQLWEGDWAKGPAGGFGTSETDWGFANNDLFDVKLGFIAESWKWTLDSAKDQGTIVYQIRRGVRWQKPNTEAGILVNGREVTADDVLYTLKRATTIGTDGFVWRGNIELRGANITKTGPWEITAVMPTAAMITGISRFGDSIFVVPPEVIAKYGDMQNWKNSIGTGPFILNDVVPGSVQVMKRNPSYWMKDPVGPGKGNQLPYLDEVRQLIIPDASTRLAALRTAKIDWIGNLSRDDAANIKKTTQQLAEKFDTSFQGRGTPLMMRTDKAPFSDIRVRKAMTMAIDFQSILKGLYGGTGQIITYPFSKVRGYEDLYLGIDDPEFPASAKELYTYNPDKAKQLLKEAGYPNGFKTTILLTNTVTAEVDYYSVVKDMWAKVGIELSLDLKENAAATNIRNSRTHEALVTNTTGPVAIFYVGNPVQGQSAFNLSMIDDPTINELMVKVRLAALSDQREAMRLFKQIAKRAIEQAYAIPNVIGTYHNLWWPWIKNYSGEITIGYDNPNWHPYVWIDQALKKSMGY